MSEAKRKGRRNKPLEALPEHNRELYRSFMFIEPVDLFDPAAVEERTKMYLDYVNQNNIAPLWTDFAYALGYNRIYLTSVMRGTSHTNHPTRTRQILEQVNLWLEAALAQYGLQHPESSIMVIWLEKNCFDYHEPTLQLQVGSNAVIEEKPRSVEEIMRRRQFVLDSMVSVEVDSIPKETKELTET